MLTRNTHGWHAADKVAKATSAKKEIIMKAISAAIFSLIITGTQALGATGGANPEGMGLLTTFFIAFAVLIILFQFLPGMTMFLAILKGIFSSEAKKPGAGAVNNSRTSL